MKHVTLFIWKKQKRQNNVSYRLDDVQYFFQFQLLLETKGIPMSSACQKFFLCLGEIIPVRPDNQINMLCIALSICYFIQSWSYFPFPYVMVIISRRVSSAHASRLASSGQLFLLTQRVLLAILISLFSDDVFYS